MRTFILLVFSLTMLVGTVSAQEKLPRFEPAPCPLEGVEKQEDVQCGYLIVPENRSLPNGRKLRLSVAVLGSLSDDPSPEPLVCFRWTGAAFCKTFTEQFNKPFLDTLQENKGPDSV